MTSKKTGNLLLLLGLLAAAVWAALKWGRKAVEAVKAAASTEPQKAVNLTDTAGKPVQTVQVPQNLWEKYQSGTLSAAEFDALPQPFAAEVCAWWFLVLYPSGKGYDKATSAFINAADKSLTTRAGLAYGPSIEQRTAYCVALLQKQGRPGVYPKA